jgi:arginase family enzyme
MGDGMRFAEPGTFMGVPASRDLSGSRAAVLGIPFDCGIHPTRVGARLGPQAIREVMHKCLQLACAGLDRAPPDQLAR